MADRPWIFRTYSGHTSAAASNALYRGNLAKGQTGLSVAFDLPTQTGYDPGSELARGEVGKVGVPISHRGDMEVLFDSIPLAEMNTSMTINATAMWLLALYVPVAEGQGADVSSLRGTTQNDIMKEYLSLGTYIFPPEHSLRLTSDLIVWCFENVPRWTPINVCSYHLQEAGATPVQEVAYALANATAVLDAVRARGQVPEGEFGGIVSRIGFFVNAGIRFVEEMCKLRAFAELWDEWTRERYGVQDPGQREFRYGVQVNSLGLTAVQPENNQIRIVLETLGVTLSRRARARAIQLPAWNEALGLPRPWDQQWSLRIHQILAFETDILEYDDLFDGSPVVEAKATEIKQAARAELERIVSLGGAVVAVEEMKSELVRSNAARLARIESGEQMVVGVNRFEQSEPSPLGESLDDAILKPDVGSEKAAIGRLAKWRAARDEAAVRTALKALAEAARSSDNLMPASIEAARAGVTTGEWASCLRDVFGEYRAPTGIATVTSQAADLAPVRERVQALSKRLGAPVRMLVAKPGLDGHSNGAEQVAVRARDAGMEVVYQGIRLTPEQIAATARDEDVDVIGLSILSGSHLALVPPIMEELRAAGVDAPVVVGGIIPDDDAAELRAAGVARVFTPKDFDLNRIMCEMADLVAAARGV